MYRSSTGTSRFTASVTSRLSGRRDLKMLQKDFLISAIDADAEEIKYLQRQTRHPSISRGFKRQRQPITSFNSLRTAYRLKREDVRQDGATSGSEFIEWLKLMTNYDFYRKRLLSLKESKQRVIIFIIVDLIVDFMFCILYVIDMVFRTPERDLYPDWLFISRPRPIWVLDVSMASWNLGSFLIRTLFNDSPMRYLFSLYPLVDLLTSVPFIVSCFIPNGQLLWVPYFLRSWMLIPRLTRALNWKLDMKLSEQPFDPLKMKLIMLISYLIVIMYSGMAAFQYVELAFADHSLSPLDSFYFMIVTMSTVGYGDITAQSWEARCVVIIIILVTLGVLPGLISGVLDTWTKSNAGGGQYSRTRTKHIILAGRWDNIDRFRDAVHGFFDAEQISERKLHLVFLSRSKPSSEIQGFITSDVWKSKITYLQGSLLQEADLKRVQARFADAVFILADRNAANPVEEDERNCLRLWSFYSYTRSVVHVPIYIYNLLPQTEVFQYYATSTVCVQDFKQVLLGYNCLYMGASTLMVNLIHQSQPPENYTEPWMAQYGDGSGNEIYSEKINPVFIGMTFAQLAWYIFIEFQCVLMAVNTWIDEKQCFHVVLNPGHDYIMTRFDQCIYIAQSPKEIRDIAGLSQEMFDESLLKYNAIPEFANAQKVYQSRRQSMTERSQRRMQLMESTVHPIKSPLANNSSPNAQFFNRPGSANAPVSRSLAVNHDDIVLSPSDASFVEAQVPLCHLLRQKISQPRAVRLLEASQWQNHILICICGKVAPLYRFLTTLRAGPIAAAEFRDIVLLLPRLPTEEEFQNISRLPRVFFMQGDCRAKKDLERAGSLQAEKIVFIGSTGSDAGGKEQLVDAPAIMASHVAHNLFKDNGIKKSVIVELSEKTNIKYLNILSPNNHQEQSHIFSSPLYAGGYVMIESLLDHLLYQSYHKSSILDVMKLLCGVRYKSSLLLDALVNVESAHLRTIPVPAEYSGLAYKRLFQDLCLKRAVIPIGLYRASDPSELGNDLPFVYTNPFSSLLLKSNDLVYVLHTSFTG